MKDPYRHISSKNFRFRNNESSPIKENLLFEIELSRRGFKVDKVRRLKFVFFTVFSFFLMGCSLSINLSELELRELIPGPSSKTLKLSVVNTNIDYSVNQNYIADRIILDEAGDLLVTSFLGSTFFYKKYNALGEQTKLVGDSAQFERWDHTFFDLAYDMKNKRVVSLAPVVNSTRKLTALDSSGLKTGFNNGRGVDFPTPSNEMYRWMGVDSQARLYVAGRVTNGANSDFRIVRLMPDGEVDSSYGNLGEVRSNVNGSYSEFFGCHISSDQKVLCAGRGGGELIVVKLHEDGAFDQTFGVNGVFVGASWAFVSATTTANMISETPTGKIFVYGRSSSDGMQGYIYAINPDGTKNLSFGVAGRLPMVEQSELSFQMRTSGEDLIIAWGEGDSVNDYLRVAKIAGDGSSVSSFGTNGVFVSSDLFANSSIATRLVVGDMTVDAEGNIFIYGNALIGDFQSSASYILKLTDQGQKDLSFGASGILKTSVIVTSREKVLDSVQKDNVTFILSMNVDSAQYRITKHIDGVLQTSFGTQGKFSSSAAGTIKSGHLTILPDDNLLVSLSYGTSVTIRKVSPSGVVVAGFVQTMNLSGATSPPLLVASDDGSVYSFYQFQSGGNAFKGGVSKIQGNSMMDTTFGTSGHLVMSENFLPLSVLYLDQKILVIGNTYRNNGTTDIVDLTIMRLNLDGNKDTTFASGGVVLWTLDSAIDAVTVKIGAQSALHMAAHSKSSAKVFIAKLNASGLPATEDWGQQGLKEVALSLEYSFQNLILDSKQQVLVCGADNISRPVLARLTSTGTLDLQFGDQGYQRDEMVSNCRSMVELPNGYAVMGEVFHTDGSQDIAMFLYQEY